MQYFSFDFSGSGISDGEYITLGVNETDDLEVVVRYLREKLGINQIVLWGRSMGAVTALRYAEIDKKIHGIISDSPFSSLYQLALELGEEKTAIPGIFLPAILKIVEQTIREKAGFEFRSLEILNLVQNSSVPCIFITSKEDNFVRSQHVEALYELYAGKKSILYVKGDHNNERTHDFLKRIANNILNMFTLKNRNNPFSNLNENKFQQKIIVHKDNNFAKPLMEDRESRKIFNLQNILDSNKELAKKIVINKNKEPSGRLDTEVLYDEMAEISSSHKTSISSAFRLKDKMQTLIHNSEHNNENIRSTNVHYSHDFGSVKDLNNSNRILKDLHQKNPSSKHLLNPPHKFDLNAHSFHYGETIKKDLIHYNIPQIQLNNLLYSNPIDLKEEIKNAKVKKHTSFNYDLDHLKEGEENF